jgi:hypothetical protein
LDAFLEIIFQYLCQCSHHFCNDLLSTCEALLSFHYSFLVVETGKSSAVTTPGNMAEETSSFMPIFWAFLSQCILEVMEDFDVHVHFFVYSVPFWC